MENPQEKFFLNNRTVFLFKDPFLYPDGGDPYQGDPSPGAVKEEVMSEDEDLWLAQTVEPTEETNQEVVPKQEPLTPKRDRPLSGDPGLGLLEKRTRTPGDGSMDDDTVDDPSDLHPEGKNRTKDLLLFEKVSI